MRPQREVLAGRGASDVGVGERAGVGERTGIGERAGAGERAGVGKRAGISERAGAGERTGIGVRAAICERAGIGVRAGISERAGVVSAFLGCCGVIGRVGFSRAFGVAGTGVTSDVGPLSATVNGGVVGVVGTVSVGFTLPLEVV